MTASRLPTPGADSGTWGQILNNFLLVEHNSDGTLKAGGSLASKYTFPVGGIPRTDLAADVQTSLANADTAASGIAPDATTGSKGIIRLSGDLTGTASMPLIAGGAVTGGNGGHIAVGTITDANIHSSATISKSKLAPLAISDSDVASGAAIAQSKIAGLSTALAGKANSSHTHPVSDVNGLQAQIDGKAATSHVHSQADVTGLAAALSGKADTSHAHTTSNISDLDQYVSGAIGNKLVPGSNILVDYDEGTGETTISATVASGGGGGSTTVTSVAGRVGEVVLGAGDITSGTFSTARIPNLDASKITTGTLGIGRVPTGTTSSTVALGNHTHDTSYATLTHTHAATDTTSGTFNIARIPTGTSNTTVALGNHTHDSSYAAIAHTHDDRYYTESEVDASLALKLDAAQKGSANGVATLGADSKIPISQLPAIAINDTFTVLNQTAMLALTAQRGDIAIRTDLGRTFVLATDSPSTLADWKELSSGGQVSSVNGNTGAVVLTAASVGAAPASHTHSISNVTGLQTALDAKAMVGLSRPEVTAVNSNSWPARSSVIPAGYTGPVTYHSGLFLNHAAPTDMQPGDDWIDRIS